LVLKDQRRRMFSVLNTGRDEHPVYRSVGIVTKECTTNVPFEFTSCYISQIHAIILSPNHIDDIVDLKIKFGLVTIFIIPFSLLMKLSDVQKCDDEIVITINKSIFGQTFGIYGPAMPYTKATLVLSASKTIDYDLVCLQTLLADEKHQKFINSVHEIPVHLYQTYFCNTKPDPGPIIISMVLGNCSPRTLGVFVITDQPLDSYTLKSSHESTKYTKPLIMSLKSLIHKKKKWTALHDVITQIVLSKVLPSELVNLILSEVRSEVCEYLYWFPMSIGKPHTSDQKTMATANLTHPDVVLGFSDSPTIVLVIVRSLNMVHISNGTAALRWE